MNLAQLNAGINHRLAVFTQKFVGFFTFIAYKLKNFKNLTLGEQLGFGSVGIGLILILISLIMFIL